MASLHSATQTPNIVEHSVIFSTTLGRADGCQATIEAIDPLNALQRILPEDVRVKLLAKPPTSPHDAGDGADPSNDKVKVGSKRRKLAQDQGSDKYGDWILLVQDHKNWQDALEAQYEALGERWWCPSQRYRIASQTEQDVHFHWENVDVDTAGHFSSLDRPPSDDRAWKASAEDVGGTIFLCDRPASSLLTVQQANSGQHTFLIPPGSAFLTTNLLPNPQGALPAGWTSLLGQVSEHEGLNLLYVDPPYPNFSAQRLAKCAKGGHVAPHQGFSYSTVADLYDLWSLKVPLLRLLEASKAAKQRAAHLAASSSSPASKRPCLVAFWITNAPKVRQFIVEKFFPAIGVRYAGEWCWLKLTAGSDGIPPQPIVSMRNPHRKKPYELLIFGWAGDVDPDAPKPRDTGDRIIASVPLGHSRKPFITDALKSLLVKENEQHALVSGQVKCPRLLSIELFGRTALSGQMLCPLQGSTACRCRYVTVGNEACKFNEMGLGLERTQESSR